MIFEIDESCVLALEAQNTRCIAFLEELALNRRKGFNIILADRSILSRLSININLSIMTRMIYKKICNHIVEMKSLIELSDIYCKVVADNSSMHIEKINDTKVIVLNVEEISYLSFPSKVKLISENLEDIQLYKKMGDYYKIKNGIVSCNIMFEEICGSGDSTADILDNILARKDAFCFCVVDSDKKYGDSTCGDTMKKVQRIEKVYSKTNDLFQIIYLEVHEVENLIPLSVIRKVIIKKCLSEETAHFLEFLVKNYGKDNNPILFFDIKKGLPCEKFILDNNTDRSIDIYNKSEKYRRYWEPIISNYGINLEGFHQPKVMDEVCAKILADSIKIMDSYNNKELIESVDEYIANYWDDIGKAIYSWGCVGNRIIA